MKTFAFDSGISVPVYIRAEDEVTAIKRLEQALGVKLVALKLGGTKPNNRWRIAVTSCVGSTTYSDIDFQIYEVDALALIAGSDGREVM